MSVGLKHSHYWESPQVGGTPGSYLGAETFVFQFMPRGRTRHLNTMLAAMLVRARMIEDDEEDIIASLFF